MGVIPSTWNFRSSWPRWTENADFQSIFRHSISAVTPGKKVQLTLTESPLCHYALSNEPKMNIVRCPSAPKGGSKTQNGRFPCKIAIRLKKICYKVYLCENRQRHSCKAFIGLSICVEMIGGEHPLLHKNLAEAHPPPCKIPTFNLFSLVAPQP